MGGVEDKRWREGGSRSLARQSTNEELALILGDGGGGGCTGLI